MSTKATAKKATKSGSTSSTGKPGTTNTVTPLSASGSAATAVGGDVALPTGVGFNTADLQNFVVINPVTGEFTQRLGYDYENSITDIILQQNMLGTSTITIQLTDPSRQILRGGFLQQGMTLQIASSGNSPSNVSEDFLVKKTVKGKTTTSIVKERLPINTSALSDASLTYAEAKKLPTLNYVLTQFTKAGDQVQLVFESSAVYRLQNQRGNGTVTTSNGTDVHAWVTSMVTAINQGSGLKNFGALSVYGPEYSTIWNDLAKGSQSTKTTSIVSVALGRGTTADPYEDTWTAISRIASSIGWRILENANVIYFGPDEFWQGNLPSQIGVDGYKQGIPPINNLKYPNGKIQTIAEFNENIQLIDFDWDVGKAYGQATVTCMLDNWQFDIGEIVQVTGLGPADDGYWMVSAMQRDAFNPQATITLSVPMPFGAVYDPTSLPQAPFPLTPIKPATKKVVKK